MKFLVPILFTIINCITAQILFHQPLPYTHQAHLSPAPVAAHRAVVENSYRESQLPDELRNDFYKDPKIADALAKESWFTNKEMPVYEREAEKIPRERIYKIFKNAGWVKRR